MRRLISNKTLWPLHVAQGRAEEISAWMAANDVEPGGVSTDHDLTVEDGPDGRVIRCQVFARNEASYKTTAPDGGPEMKACVVPLVVEPPEGWPVYALTDREEQP